ncbi:MAG: sugar transferase, partial [Planctomycetota bacterium]
MTPRLLFVAHRVPYPPDKGERLRAFHQLHALSRSFRVTLAAPVCAPAEAAAAEALRERCENVLLARAGGRRGWLRATAGALRGRSLSEGYFASGQLGRQIHSAGPYDLAVGCCSSMLGQLLAAPAAACVLDLVDVDSAKWRDYVAESRLPRRWIYQREARAVARRERQALQRCDAVAVVSQPEADLLSGGPA